MRVDALHSASIVGANKKPAKERVFYWYEVVYFNLVSL